MAMDISRNQSVALGSAIPPFTAHAISVSLPTWNDNVDYEEGKKRVVDAMASGYPRFFIHPKVQKLASLCEQKFGVPGERSLLFPTKRIAESCRAFMLDRASSPLQIRLIQFLVLPEDKRCSVLNADCDCSPCVVSSTFAELHIVLFHGDAFPLAKQFWQHTGTGISSRLAEFCLSVLHDEFTQLRASSPTQTRFFAKNRHYNVKGSTKSPTSPIDSQCPQTKHQAEDHPSADQSVYVEERYGRNLPLDYDTFAKRAMRRRIAGLLVNNNNITDCPDNKILDADLPSPRGVTDISENDVYLFPTGMSAIWHAHQLALFVRPPSKSVCFGFPYTDTLKILEKFGPGCRFFGHGLDADLDTLEDFLKREVGNGSITPPVLALFTEFPSNPLLRCADLPRLRTLADKYDFLIVIDETIGNFVNVQVLPYADVVVSSLSKIFSGDSNVMGGSLVLNPNGRHYKSLKSGLEASFEDVYFGEDAICMERNSRDFRRRIRVINSNAEAVCDFLRSRSMAGGVCQSVLKNVFYPKWETRDHYERCRIRSASNDGDPDGGFGGLFSLTFTSASASQAFFDALSCHKGPSLGTNFTLACPYTILAHYMELEWAAQYGVEDNLVRVSVGMEEATALLQIFGNALKAAEDSTLLE